MKEKEREASQKCAEVEQRWESAVHAAKKELREKEQAIGKLEKQVEKKRQKHHVAKQKVDELNKQFVASRKELNQQMQAELVRLQD